MSDFDNIVLNFKERFILFTLSIFRVRKGDVFSSSLHHLYQCDLIKQNYLPERDSLGQFIPDGTYSLSDSGRRYKIYLRRNRVHRYLTPITVSVITTVVIDLLKHLWLPVLLNWLSGLF